MSDKMRRIEVTKLVRTVVIITTPVTLQVVVIIVTITALQAKMVKRAALFRHLPRHRQSHRLFGRQQHRRTQLRMRRTIMVEQHLYRHRPIITIIFLLPLTPHRHRRQCLIQVRITFLPHT